MVVQNPCSVCKRAVARTHRAVWCKSCHLKCHIKCGKIAPKDYNNVLTNLFWRCPSCESMLNLTISDNVYEDLLNTLNGAKTGLTIGHINVNGLRGKIAEIRYLLSEVKFDVIAITETHLSSDIENNEILVDDYNIIRQDRDNGQSSWGGTAIYFKCSLNGYCKININKFQIESSWLELNIRSQTVLIGCVYNPPGNNKIFIESFDKLLQQRSLQRKNLVILGDINIDLLSDYNSKKLLLNLLLRSNMQNVITEATRITNTSRTLIDMAFTPKTAKILCSGSLDYGISDHHLIYLKLDLKKQKQKPKIITCKNFKNVDVQKLQQEIDYAPWHICDLFDDIDDTTWAWETMYKSIVNEHIKERRVKIRSKSSPWMNGSIRKELNRKYKLLKTAQNTNSDSDWKQYKVARNYCTHLVRSAEAIYWKKRFSDVSTSREFWKTIKEFQGQQRDTSIGPIKDLDNQKVVNDVATKCNVFNEYFSTVGLSTNLTNDTASNSHIYRVTPIVSELNINPDILMKCFKSVKSGKAPGLDNITSDEIKLVGKGVMSGLGYVFRKSARYNVYPTQWKIANAKCLFKKGDKLDVQNYRPVSLLSIPSKMFEYIICSTIDQHLTAHNLITDRQWGFKKGVSPEMHLINMTETWREHIEQGKLIGVIFLDFRKAFDSVSHQTLLMKLQAAGISGNLYELLRNYLQNRLQYVSIGNVFSNKQNVLAGVPQGSLFGPRAYKIYSNNLPDSTSNDLEMFADDSTGYCVSDSLYELCMVLQNTILELEKWAKINSLNIHPVKTELMILSKKPVFGPFPLICVGNKPVNFVMKSKCLGIYIDRNLTWNDHINMLCKRFDAKVKMLKRMKALNSKTLETFYFSNIIPCITYGISVWGNCSKAMLDKLNNIHVRAAKIIFNRSDNVDNDIILEKVSWKPMLYFYKKAVLVLMHKVFHRHVPNRISEKFKIHETSHNLRSRNNFVIKRCTSNNIRYSFIYRGSNIWNILPDSVKEIQRIDLFKKHLKQHSSIIENFSFDPGTNTRTFSKEDYVYF